MSKTDNELIAEFMGQRVFHTVLEMQAVPIAELTPYYYVSQLKYDTSWDWLMPVVEKIRYANIEGTRRNELIDNVNYALSCVDIDEVYKNVVKFITHYNTKKKP